MELCSPGSFPRAVFPYSASPEVDAAAHTSALGTEVLDVQTQLWMEGLEKWSSFIETGLVKLASEPSTEIMWLLTMQHHPRSLRESPGKARGRVCTASLPLMPGELVQQQQVSFPIYGKTLL